MLHHPFQNNVIIHSHFTQMRKNSVFALLYYGAFLPSCKAVFHVLILLYDVFLLLITSIDRVYYTNPDNVM